MSLVLVTGANGFIGTNLISHLLSENYTVIAYDKLIDKLHVRSNLEVIKGDILDQKFIEFLKDAEIETVYHLAAQTDVVYSTKNLQEDMINNYLGCMAVSELVYQNKHIKNVVYTNSGGAIYGETKSLPKTEVDPIEPMSPYGISKYSGELAIIGTKFKCLNRNLNITSLRLSNVYGPDAGKGLLPLIADCLKKNLMLTIYGNGENIRDYVYITDVVRALIKSSQLDSTNVLNCSSGIGYSINSIIRKFEIISKKSIRLNFAPPRQGEIVKSIISSKKATSVLNWQPEVSIEEGIQHLLNYSQV